MTVTQFACGKLCYCHGMIDLYKSLLIVDRMLSIVSISVVTAILVKSHQIHIYHKKYIHIMIVLIQFLFSQNLGSV